MKSSLIVTGAPGSPYTRKVLAAARYCRIPYRFISDLSVSASLPQPRVKLWPVCYFPDEDEVPETDSTPILRRFDRLAPTRAIVPSDPRLALVDALIEDYADEWLTKAMFHYRWTYPADIAKATRVLPNWFESPLSDEELKTAGKIFAERQISRLGLVGSNAVTAPLIESGFLRLLACLEQCLTRSRFVLGSRPATADFALYGQLTQAALFDPTSSRLVDERAPRVTAWTIAIEDLSGLADGDWYSFEKLADEVRELLHEIGRTHARLLLANEDALRSGQSSLRTTIAGQPWEQPVFPYQLKCLSALRSRFAGLATGEKDDIRNLFQATGCGELFD